MRFAGPKNTSQHTDRFIISYQLILGCQTTADKVELASWRFKYAEKEMRVSGMTVNTKKSRSSCTPGTSFGFDAEKVWVDKGCRASFDVTLACEY